MLQFLASTVSSQLINATLQVINFTQPKNYSMVSNTLPTFFFNPYQGYPICTGSKLFIYLQSPRQLQVNQPYYIYAQGSGVLSFTVYSKTNIPIPTINPVSCTLPCNLTVLNNCPQGSAFQNIFQIDLQVEGLKTSVAYGLDCNSAVAITQFTFGLLILILLSIVYLLAVVNYSRAWSYGGFGWEFNLIIFGVVIAIIIISGIIINYKVDVVVNIFNWIFAIVSVTFCINEFLYLFKFDILNKPRLWKFRLLDLISLASGIGMAFCWWFTNLNWIANDIISSCMMLMVMKLIKFRSMCQAFSFMLFLFSVQVLFTLLIKFLLNQQYSNYLIAQFNSPLEIQIPSLVFQLGSPCNWLPATTLGVCGMLLVYLKRFDKSRNSYVYTVSALLGYSLGSFCWLIVIVFNVHMVPMAIFVYPIMTLFVFLISFCRKQNNTIWNGLFYDEEFIDLRTIIRQKQNQNLPSPLLFLTDLPQ